MKKFKLRKEVANLTAADKRLTKLGFTKVEESRSLGGEVISTKLYYSSNPEAFSSLIIAFNSDKRYVEYSMTGIRMTYFNVSIELHEAIGDKMKELGWV